MEIGGEESWGNGNGPAGDPQQPFSIRPADESLVKPFEGNKDFPPDHDREEGDPVGQQQASWTWSLVGSHSSSLSRKAR